MNDLIAIAVEEYNPPLPINSDSIHKGYDARKDLDLKFFNEKWCVFDLDFHELRFDVLLCKCLMAKMNKI